MELSAELASPLEEDHKCSFYTDHEHRFAPSHFHPWIKQNKTEQAQQPTTFLSDVTSGRLPESIGQGCGLSEEPASPGWPGFFLELGRWDFVLRCFPEVGPTHRGMCALYL